MKGNSHRRFLRDWIHRPELRGPKVRWTFRLGGKVEKVPKDGKKVDLSGSQQINNTNTTT